MHRIGKEGRRENTRVVGRGVGGRRQALYWLGLDFILFLFLFFRLYAMIATSMVVEAAAPRQESGEERRRALDAQTDRREAHAVTVQMFC